ncbi:MAG: glycosyltransferase family 4 protein [Alphaproteobacteria bacterium]|jgi:glycosyltransferase involved in cell wall biosynthesis
MQDATENSMLRAELASEPPCVMQVLPSLVTGGVERGAVEIAAALVDSGGRAIVVSSGGPMAHEVTRVGAEHITLPVHSKNPFVIRKNIDRLARIIRSKEVDIVHARSRAPAWSAYYAAQKTNAHFVTTFHGTYNLGPPLKKFYNSIMTRGEKVIAISDHIARHILETYPCDPARIRVIHRGVDLDIFDPTRVSAERVIKLSTEWRLPDGVPVIMLPGRLARWKGHMVLIEALALLKRDDIRCIIVGSDEGRSRYVRDMQAQIEALNLGSVVHIVGDCRDMPAALMLSDVVVHASTDPEAFGRVIIEAQAMGRPVVAADHGASREIIEPGESGWLAKPGDPEDLAQALRAALGLSTQERAQLAQRTRALSLESFSKTAMCAATLEVYQSVLAPPRRDAA